MNALSYAPQEIHGESGEVKSAARSLELLELFAAHRDGLSLGEVCVLTGWPKSSTLALLRTLRAHDTSPTAAETMLTASATASPGSAPRISPA